MDLTGFYGIISGINFTLLGLWWVAAKDRPELRTAKGKRIAYLVSLGFVIPGTISLLSQVAPEQPILWRTSFAIAAVAGAIGMFLLAKELGDSLIAQLMRFGAAPIYALVGIIALFPRLISSFDLTPLQVEAILLCLLVFLGVQAAWAVAMTDQGADPTPGGRGTRR